MKAIIQTRLWVALSLLSLVLLLIGLNSQTFGSSFSDPRNTTDYLTASSTAYSITFGGGVNSTRVLATSSGPGGRVAVSVQANNCVSGGQLWINFNDVRAATTTSYSLAASSTVVFVDVLPVPFGSLRVTASSAACTAVVHEFRTQF